MENILLLIGCIFSLISITFFVLIVYIMHINKQVVNNWDVVVGEIKTSSLSEIEETIIASIDDFEDSELKTIKLNIQYQYYYESEMYTSSNLYALKINNIFLSNNLKKKIHNNLLSNKNTEVYVNPLTPQQSAIFKEISLWDKIIPSIVFLLMGLAFIIYNFIN